MNKALILASVAAVAAGCSSAPPASRAKPAPSAAAPATMDWSKVEPATNGGQILAWKTLARHCDAWYKGSRMVVDLRFNPDGHAEDGEGRRMKIAAADWKGVVHAAQAPGAKVEAFASLSDVYASGREDIPQDKFGTKARYRYRITAVSDDILRFSIVEKMDGGV